MWLSSGVGSGWDFGAVSHLQAAGKPGGGAVLDGTLNGFENFWNEIKSLPIIIGWKGMRKAQRPNACSGPTCRSGDSKQS